MSQNYLQQAINKRMDALKKNWTSRNEFFDWMYSEEGIKAAYRTLGEYYGPKDDISFYRDSQDRLYPLLTSNTLNRPVENINNILGEYTDEKRTRLNQKGLTDILESIACHSTNSKEDIDNFDADEKLWNADIYRITGYDSDTHKFSFALTDYFTAISQTKRLYYELFNTIYDVGYTSRSDATEAAHNLPFRDMNVPTTGNAFQFDMKNRYLGVSIFTVFNTGQDYVTPIVQRASGMAHYPDWYSVAPAGNFQQINNPQTDFDLERHILREYGEELFDHEEDASSVFQNSQVERVTELLNTDKAHLWYTGTGVNALDTSVNMTALLVIDDPEYYQNCSFKSNWESQTMDFISLTDPTGFADVLTPYSMVAESVLALEKGAPILEEKYGIKTPALN